MKRDPKISDIFYYFQEHTNIANGRTAGRKIGTMDFAGKASPGCSFAAP